MAEKEPEGRVAARRRARNARQSPHRSLIWRYALNTCWQSLWHGDLAAGEAATVLQEHLMRRVPIEGKLKLLGEVMDAYAFSELFPFVTPCSPSCSGCGTSSPIP